MLRYMTDKTRPGLVALYDMQPGNGAGQFLQPRKGQKMEKESHTQGNKKNRKMVSKPGISVWHTMCECQ